jgi:DNA-binding NtrC family response regulator
MPHHLLIVDDDAAIGSLLRRYLERLGYHVDACTTPHDALKLAESRTEPYALVITDLTLEKMNGEDLVGQIRQRSPDTPAIITSGYPHVPRARGVAFLQKPFLPKMLADLIEETLKGDAPGRSGA